MHAVDADGKSGGCGVKESSRRGEGAWSGGGRGGGCRCEDGCESLSAVVVEAVLGAVQAVRVDGKCGGCNAIRGNG